MTLAIDAGPLHPTTQACLEALQWLHGQKAVCKNILDMGCGSGILAVAAAGLWRAPTLAADISEKAVADTHAHAHAHGLETLVTPVRSDGFRHATIKEKAPYDLIVFNLLAEPIVQMAPQVKAHLAPEGHCLLSGILEWMAADVEAAYKGLGFEVLHSIKRAPWTTYLLRPIGQVTLDNVKILGKTRKKL